MQQRLWDFDVGTTTERPIIVDQYISRVTVEAESYGEAMDTATLMAMRPGVSMVTSTTYMV